MEGTGTIPSARTSAKRERVKEEVPSLENPFTSTLTPALSQGERGKEEIPSLEHLFTMTQNRIARNHDALACTSVFYSGWNNSWSSRIYIPVG